MSPFYGLCEVSNRTLLFLFGSDTLYTCTTCEKRKLKKEIKKRKKNFQYLSSIEKNYPNTFSFLFNETYHAEDEC